MYMIVILKLTDRPNINLRTSFLKLNHLSQKHWSETKSIFWFSAKYLEQITKVLEANEGNNTYIYKVKETCFSWHNEK